MNYRISTLGLRGWQDIGGRLLAAFLLIGTGLLAQPSNRATLRGTVSNQATGDLLSGAIIRVAERNISTTTDRGGRYQISLPPGTYTLRFSYTGLDDETVTIQLPAAETLVRDIDLTSPVYELEEFAVTGIREGNALALQLQRQAANVKTVAATDTFGNPAANPGELLQRLPGVTSNIVGGEVRQISIRGMDRTFNSVMLDGNRVANSGSASYIREVQLEQMGTVNVETVEVIKAPTPDMDADAIAGFVNLITKRAFDRPPGRRITFNVGSVWKDRESDTSPEKDSPGLDLLALTYSDVYSVFGGENNLGISANALRRHGYTLQDEVQHLYRFNDFDEPGDPILQRRFRTREFVNPDYTTNFGFNVDYKLSEDSFAYARITANKRDQYQRFRGGQWLGTTKLANYEPGSDYQRTVALPVDAHRFEVFAGLFTKKNYNYTVNLGAEHNLAGDWKISYDAFRSFAETDYGDRNSISGEVEGVGWIVDRANTDPWFPDVAQNGGPSVFEPDNYQLEPFTFLRRKSNHTVLGAKIDFRKDFDTAIPTYIKFGGKWGNEQRERDWGASRFTHIGADGVAGSADDVITPYLDQGYDYKQTGGRYGPWPAFQIPDTGQEGDLVLAMDAHPEWFVQDWFYTARENRRRDAEIDETIEAAYIMGNMDFGRFRILGGLRVEEVTVEAENFKRVVTSEERQRRRDWIGPVTPEEQVRRVAAEWPEKVRNNGNYRDVFPGIHLVHEPMDGLLFRASWNTSITRPSVGHILPGFDANEETQRINIGNPDLQPFYSNNFEFGFEKYFEPVGLIGAGVFLKEIENYSANVLSIVESGPDNGFEGEFEGWELRQRQNLGDARIRGFEVNYQQQFSFLPGIWSGLGAFANFTYLEAEGTFGGTQKRTQLGGLTPKSGNLGISFVKYGWQVRAMANYLSRQPRSSRASPTALWREAREMFDLKIQYKINRNYDLFLDVVNITNESTRAQEYEFGHKQFGVWQGVSWSAGIKGRF